MVTSEMLTSSSGRRLEPHPEIEATLTPQVARDLYAYEMEGVRRELAFAPAGTPRRISGMGTRAVSRRPRVRAALAAVVLLAVGVFGVLELTASTSRQAPPVLAVLRALPVAAQGPVSAALGRDDGTYLVRRLAAENRDQRLRIGFSAAGVRVSSGRAAVSIAVSAYGYASSLKRVGPAAARVSANRVSYARPGLREWYANGPLGLEQGFDVAARPNDGTGPLTIALALSGTLRPRSAGDSVLLTGKGTALRYGGLVATDASGRRLRSWLSLVAGRLLIHVNDRGARYPLRIDPLVQQAELTASGGEPEDYMGWSVAISGDTIVVGDPNKKVAGKFVGGAAYVFQKPASGWANATQTAQLGITGLTAEDSIGNRVAISGDTIVVADTHRKVGANFSAGAAFVFVKPASGWGTGPQPQTQTAELTASDGVAGNLLGYAVAISGDTVVAGPAAHTVNGHSGDGAAYVFVKPAAGWGTGSQPQHEASELVASDGQVNDNLGASVAVAGDTVVAGAPFRAVGANSEQGEAYVFLKPGGGWGTGTQPQTQTAELVNSDGGAKDEMSYSIAVSGNTIVAGAPGHAFQEPGFGAAYVFQAPAGGWGSGSQPQTQTAELAASDGNTHDRLGASVAIEGETVAAGAPYHWVGAHQAQGELYDFVMPSTGWTSGTETAESTNPAAVHLGESVGVSGGTLVTGAPFANVGSNELQGATYVFAGPAPNPGGGSGGGSGGGGSAGSGGGGGGGAGAGASNSTSPSKPGPVTTPSKVTKTGYQSVIVGNPNEAWVVAWLLEIMANPAGQHFGEASAVKRKPKTPPTITIASTRVRVSPHGHLTVKLKLSAAARKVLHGHPRRVTLKIQFTVAGHAPTTVTRSILLHY
jgi:hypothetical protein